MRGSEKQREKGRERETRCSIEKGERGIRAPRAEQDEGQARAERKKNFMVVSNG